MRPIKLVFFLFVLSISSLRADGNASTETLAKACRLGDLKTAENLLSLGISPDVPDRFGRSPLYYAASFNNTQVVQLLLAYHADPNAQVNSGRDADAGQAPVTPLQYAAYLGNLRISSILIKAGAHIDTSEGTGRTALHFAVTARHLDVMRFLIEQGADLNTRDAEGASPLDDAVWTGSLDATAILLAHGAHLNEMDTKTGATPINEAAFRGNAPLIRYLLQFHPDLGIADKQGHGPLENAIRMGKEDSALLLLEAEPKERATPQFFERTMDAAIRNNESVLVATLLKQGALANDTLPSGSTPLDTAAAEGATPVVRVLLDNGADPNRSGRNGTSPLEDASLKGFDGIVGMLLDHGALVDHLNSASGTTALYAAASFGKSNVAKLLLERGANPNLCGKNGRTPYQAALENGYKDAATQIQSHGGAKSCAK